MQSDGQTQTEVACTWSSALLTPPYAALQTLLHKHLLMGHEFRTAFRLASGSLEGTHFRHWRDGVHLS
jgi:hypothetical protein